MAEYIEREATLNVLRNLGSRDYRRTKGTIMDAMKMIMHSAYTPTADVAEVKHGEWKIVYQNEKATVYECSECNHLTFGTSDYCICGARMDGESEWQIMR